MNPQESIIYNTTPGNIITPPNSSIVRVFRNSTNGKYYGKLSDGTIQEIGLAGALPYGYYAAILTQSGAGLAPTAIVLYNNIGTITYSHFSVGGYYANSAGLFIANKTGAIISKDDLTQNTSAQVEDNNKIFIQTGATGGSPLDGILNNTLFQIIVGL